MSDLRITSSAEPRPVVEPKMPKAPPAAAETFGETLGRMVQSVNDLQTQAHEASVALASGQPIDMSQALVTIEEANISLQLALQIRNKLLEAYQDVMRMPV
jgi:flagellar hook-basal body complex protein FliE